MDGIGTGIVRQSLRIVEEDYESDSSKPVIILPDPPDFMNYEAKCEFLRSIEDVVLSGSYSGPGIGIFENYCIAMGFAKEFEQTLAEDGKIVGGKPHPAWKMMLDAMTNARASWESLKPRKIIINKEEEESEEDNPWKKDKGLLA